MLTTRAALTVCPDLRTWTAHIGLLESTRRTGLQELAGRIGSLKLTEHASLLVLIGGKVLQILTGLTGLLKFFD